MTFQRRNRMKKTVSKVKEKRSFSFAPVPENLANNKGSQRPCGDKCHCPVSKSCDCKE